MLAGEATTYAGVRERLRHDPAGRAARFRVVPRTQAANGAEPVVPVLPADGLHGIDFVDVTTGRGLTRAELTELVRGGRYPARVGTLLER